MATVASLVPKVATFLVGKANQRRRTTYGEVAQAVETHPRVVPMVLEVIRALCIERDWPALTSIVVSSTTGKPGEAFLDPWVSRDTVAAAKDMLTGAMQDKVCEFDWRPLLSHFGCSPELPINVTLQVSCAHGGDIRVAFPGHGAETIIESAPGSPKHHSELFQHLRRLLAQAGQWPER